MNKDYDMVQQRAAPQPQDLYVLKEASKILVPTTEQQTVQTLKAFTVLLFTMVGPTHLLYLATKQDLVDQYNTFQPLVETYIVFLHGQPVYTKMVHWVQLWCNAYWNLVFHSFTRNNLQAQLWHIIQQHPVQSMEHAIHSKAVLGRA